MGPSVAGIAKRLGPAVRSKGGKWMHSSNEGYRKMGSKMMGASNDKIEAGMTKLVKNTDLSLKVMGKISKTVGKVLGVLAKSSPALKQQLVIMNKGLGLMLRPIGDIMAKFLRPMSIWVMKVAQKWYAKFGTGGGDSELAKEDALDNAQKQLQSLIAGGAPKQEIAAAQANVDALSANKKDDSKSPLAKLWENLIPKGLKDALSAIGEAFKGLWDIMKQLAGIVWDVLGPYLKSVAEIVGGVLVGALYAVTFVFKGLAFVLELVAKGIELVRDMLKVGVAWLELFANWVGEKLVQAFDWTIEKIKVAWEWIGTKLPAAWQTLKDGMSTLHDWVVDTFLGIWDKIKTAMSNMWDGVKSIIDKIKFWKHDDDEVEEKATGGSIDTTGLYKLHAGERVINAGDNSRAGDTSSSTNINNYISIQAAVNNDMDISELASRLAELNETQLRRRVSYI